MNKEKEIRRVAEEICSGVNSQETRKKKDYLEVDMLTNFGVLGLLTPSDLAEVFYNGFANCVISETGGKE